MFRKVLVANRGEIAVRVIRALRELGILSVAVCSEADRNALHTELADESIEIGPSLPLQSYLNISAIIAAAKQSGAEAIHPGYGFLSENADFAEACIQAGLTFIGPPVSAMRLMGNKVAARKTLSHVGIPLVPGTEGKESDVDAIIKAARALDFPVLVKASAGGGGKGMRIVESEGALRVAIEAAMREAQSAFGNASVYVERYIENPRHIEIQVLADLYGHTLHLFERECSIQRRHQKVVEETPSTAITPAIREAMGATAVKVAQIAGYVNAGTVEFLLDSSGHFYFLEMNTRIQVEHPITEMTTGIDLVAWQIRIAAGERLSFVQKDLTQRGHAIECRIYAEDPARGFLPAPGHLLYVQEPSGPGIRNDTGIRANTDVSGFYDPILSKVIVWAEDRESARRRMIQALNDYIILGIPTTIDFLRDLLAHPSFIAGETYTHFIERHMAGWKGSSDLRDLARLAAALYQHQQQKSQKRAQPQHRIQSSPWLELGAFEIGKNDLGAKA